MKTVAIYSYVPKLHTLYKEIINNPPRGYRYAVDPSKLSSSLKSFYTNQKVKDAAQWSLVHLLDTVRIKDSLYRFKRFPKHELLYSTGYLCHRREPWVVDMEFPTSLTGYSMERFERRKAAIAKLLASKHCKKIIPWTDAASESMRKAFLGRSPQLKAIREKIRTVPLTVGAKKERHIGSAGAYGRKSGKGKKTRFLFVGSSNMPEDFAIKGGPETLEAFARLRKKRDDVELVCRCYVPPEYRQRYAKTPDLTIVDKIIPWKELVALYTHADAFVGVAHHTPGVGHLEAMSYGLPVIATDIWENAKIVSKEVGLLIPPHVKAKYTEKYSMPCWGTPKFMQQIATPDEKRLRALVRAMAALADNPGARRRMGVAARRLVETGAYSTKAKNKILKEVFDEATAR